MRIKVNGDNREVPDALTLEALINFLELPSDRLAVELNRQVIRRAEWSATNLSDGDQLEVVHFVGGGCSAVAKNI